MLRVRLSRRGKKNDPFYRIVVQEKHRKNTGLALEVLGTWYPEKNDFKIDKKKYDTWIKKGAKPSETVKKLVSQS